MLKVVPRRLAVLRLQVEEEEEHEWFREGTAFRC